MTPEPGERLTEEGAKLLQPGDVLKGPRGSEVRFLGLCGIHVAVEAGNGPTFTWADPFDLFTFVSRPTPVEPGERLSAEDVAGARRNVIRLALEEADALERTAEDADDNQWQDWGATMRQAAGLIRSLASHASQAAEIARLREQVAGDRERARTAAEYLCRLEGAMLSDDLDMKLNFPGEASPTAAAEALLPGFDSIEYDSARLSTLQPKEPK